MKYHTIPRVLNQFYHQAWYIFIGIFLPIFVNLSQCKKFSVIKESQINLQSVDWIYFSYAYKRHYTPISWFCWSWILAHSTAKCYFYSREVFTCKSYSDFSFSSSSYNYTKYIYISSSSPFFILQNFWGKKVDPVFVTMTSTNVRTHLAPKKALVLGVKSQPRKKSTMPKLPAWAYGQQFQWLGRPSASLFNIQIWQVDGSHAKWLLLFFPYLNWALTQS